ncbi:TonB-dependent receptor [Sphingomonas sp.]|jgi:iron complex outermembrane receptor protein|uniref:TonB-dependent receptor n=1 Tax=Sphingomonas sp. TaxID=28214 RepID=UPI0035C7F98A
MKSHYLVGVALALVLSATMSAQAQTATGATATDATDATAQAEPEPAPPSSGDIIVTAQRRSESLQKVPIAISAISQDDLAKRGIINTAQLTGTVPSLQVNSPYGEAQPNFTIRGIGVANEHNPNQASPVGVYFDDAYIAARAEHGLQLYDLERIEVLRGPQGTLYGRNTTGGTINFISRRPDLSGSTGNIQAGYANFNTFTAQGAAEATLKEGVAGLRVSFNYAHGNGYINNRAANEPDMNSTDMLGARAILRVKPTDRLEILLKGTYGRSNPRQAAVFNLGTGPNGFNPVLGTSRAEKGLGFFEADSQRVGRSFVEAYGSELIVKYDLTDDIQLTSLTSYDHLKQAFTQEGAGLQSPVFRQPLDTLYGNVFDMFNQELRVAYSNDRTNVQAGVYYGYDKDASDSYYWLLDGAAMVRQKYDQIRRSYAAFAQGDQKFGDHVSITLGLRYTLDRGRYQNYASYAVPQSLYTGTRDISSFPPAQGTYFLGGYDATTGQFVSGPTLKLDSNAVTGRAALNYTFDTGQIVYASYSRGYRAAAFCGQCFFGPINTTRPEQVDAYEIGAKGRTLDDMLSLSVAGFWMNYSNQQINEQIGAQTILRNVDKSRIRGVEIEGTLTPATDLRIQMSASFLDARYQALQLSAGDLTGRRLPYAPRFSATGSLDWTLARLGAAKVVFTPSFVHTGLVYFTPYNRVAGNGNLRQDANTKVNLQLAYETPSYTVRGWVTNLTNEKTFADGLDLRASFGYDYLVQAPPRTYGATVAYRF